MLRLLSLASALLLSGFPAIALADVELPKRRSGLWEYTHTVGGKQMITKQCVDQTTDKLAAGAVAQGRCTPAAFTKVGDAYHGGGTCKIGPITSKSQSVITGDFESRLRLEVVTEVAGAPGTKETIRRETVMEMKWVGPCTDGLKPGDILLPTGKIVKTPGSPQ